jgi:hypothetical protein
MLRGKVTTIIFISLLICLSLLSLLDDIASAQIQKKTVAYKAQNVKISFQKGIGCIKRSEKKENCFIWAAGEAEYPVTDGQLFHYAFHTTENQNAEPFLVTGRVNSIFMNNVTAKRCKVGGMLFAVEPTMIGLPFEGLDQVPIRLYIEDGGNENDYDYEWMEVSIFGVYDPTYDDLTPFLEKKKKQREEYLESRRASANRKDEENEEETNGIAEGLTNNDKEEL